MQFVTFILSLSDIIIEFFNRSIDVIAVINTPIHELSAFQAIGSVVSTIFPSFDTYTILELLLGPGLVMFLGLCLVKWVIGIIS